MARVTQLVDKNNVTKNIYPHEVDSTPTLGSDKMVTSNGIKTALNAKQDTMTIDNTVTTGDNPVKSSGIKAYVDNAVSGEATRSEGVYVRKDAWFDAIPLGMTHNGIYHDNDISAMVSDGTLWTTIASQEFRNVFPGSKIVRNGTTYIVAGLNIYYNIGDTALTTNHIGVIPLSSLGNIKMNSTNTTVGGYAGSEAHIALNNTSGTWYSKIASDFGASHIISHRVLLSNAINADASPSGYSAWTGCTSGWAWSYAYMTLLSEPQAYGTTVWGNGYDVGEAKEMLPVYRLNPNVREQRGDFWLRSVASATGFAVCNYGGYANGSDASNSLAARPLFLLK